MNKKGGRVRILLVILLFLVLLVWAEEQAPPAPESASPSSSAENVDIYNYLDQQQGKFEGLIDSISDCSARQEANNMHPLESTPHYASKLVDESKTNTNQCFLEYKFGSKNGETPPMMDYVRGHSTWKLGCFIGLADEMEGNDDCGGAMVRRGTIIDQDNKMLESQRLSDNFGWQATENIEADELRVYTGVWGGEEGGNSNQHGIRCYHTTKSTSSSSGSRDRDTNPGGQRSYLCVGESDTANWYECTDAHIGAIFYGIESEGAGSKATQYECKKADTEYDKPHWKERGNEGDVDGFTEEDGDCVNNIEAQGQDPICAEIQLTLDDVDNQGLSEVRQLAAEKCKGANYPLCAMCINPGSPEICGDEINNDCGGPLVNSREEVQVLEGKTSDNCDQNRYACTNSNPYALEGTSWPQADKNRITELTNEGFQFPTEFNNPLKEKFSWINTAEGGFCCGDDGWEDLGQQPREWDGDRSLGGRLCLKKDLEFVGPELEGEWCTEGETCGSNWGLFSATDKQFTIFTIKKLFGTPYDIVSNGVEWQNCDQGYLGSMESKPLSRPIFSGEAGYIDELREHSNRFQCYKEGERYAWAECIAPDKNLDNAGIKGRAMGEALYSLPLITEDEAEMQANLPFMRGRTVEIKKENYEKYYGDNTFLDFSGYDFLNFYVKFCADGDTSETSCTGLTPNNLILPANVRLQIFGSKGEDDTNLVFYDSPVLGYVVNNPTFSDNYLHVRVPISNNMNGVEIVSLSSVQETNNIEVRNVYLTKKVAGSEEDSEEEPPLLCSGIDTTAGEGEPNSWLLNADEGTRGETVNGQKLCQQLFGPEAWLGMNEDTDDDTANCCGDDDGEYYGGNSAPFMAEGDARSGKKFGCWNSQPIASGETVMEVEVKVGYTESVRTIRYETPQFNYDIISKKLILEKILFSTGFESPSCTVPDNLQTVIETYPQLLPLSSIVSKPFEEFNPTDATPSTLYYTVGECTGKSAGRCDYACQYYLPILEQVGTPIDDQISVHYGTQQIQTIDLVKNNFVVTKKDNGSSSSLPFYGGEILFIVNPVPPSGSEGIVFSIYDSTGTKVSEDDKVKLTEDILNQQKLYFVSINNMVTVPEPQAQKISPSTLTFSCSSDECLYPLPGIPPYTISNPHPELYELYFVYGPEQDQEIFIKGEGDETPQEFNLAGNIKARKIAQQVLFNSPSEEEYGTLVENEADNPDAQTGFFGCNAADYLTNLLENRQNCAQPLQGYVCSPQAMIRDSKNLYTIINTWVKDETRDIIGTDELAEEAATGTATPRTQQGTQIGYNTHVGYGFEVDPTPEQDIADLHLKLLGLPTQMPGYKSDKLVANNKFKPEYLNQTSTVLFTQNFIPNAEFRKAGKVLPYWKVMEVKLDADDPPSGSGIFTLDLIEGDFIVNIDLQNSDNRDLVKDSKVTLGENMHLISERIAIPPGILIYNDTSVNCKITIKLINNNGDTVESPISITGVPHEFSTGGASFLTLKYANTGCVIEKPNLQLKDDALPFVNSPYNSQKDTLKNFDLRSGVACCPQNFCWNGYSCVEPMEQFPQMAEHAGEERDYRCIAGQWKELPKKYDWNGQNWGFCQKEDQCLVSRAGAYLKDGTDQPLTAADFMKALAEPGDTLGPFPSCVNSGTYILDHYCYNGAWSSRTKFVAAKLQEIGGREAENDYSLYCTDHRGILTSYHNGLTEASAIITGSQLSTAVPASADLGAAISNAPAPLDLACFGSKLGGLGDPQEDTCINNACVLQYHEGEQTKTVLGTSLNLPLTHPQSFLGALNVPFGAFSTICPAAVPGTFVRCDQDEDAREKAGLQSNSVWYSSDINAVIYAKDGVEAEPSTFQNVIAAFVTFLQGLLGVEDTPSNEENFLQEAQNYRDVFILSKDQKKIRAMNEMVGKQGRLRAEYENFETPVCEYVDKDKVNVKGFELEPLEEQEGRTTIECSSEGNTHTLNIVARNTDTLPLQELWPQLTGMLRVEE